MKAAVVYGADDIRIEDYADPVAGPGEVVVATKVAGICGKDVKTMLGEGLTENPWTPSPTSLISPDIS